MLRSALFLVMIAGPALAQGLRPDDVRFSSADLTVALAGQTVEFFDGSKAYYGADGSYAYTYTDDDPPFVGQFTTDDDSRVCVVFDNGFGRCDTFVQSNGRLVLIIEDGTRFPARAVTPTKD